MGKITAPKVAIASGIVAVCIACALLLRNNSEHEVNAMVSPSSITLGQTIHYADSTIDAKQWHWEFGDGGESTLQSGVYKPNSLGNLAIRLTVNGKAEKRFNINIIAPVTINDSVSIIQMEVPKEVMQGEYVTFKGIGIAKDWRWEFGETGRVDSHDQVAMYAYQVPGTYLVKLSTNTTEYPIQQEIRVLSAGPIVGSGSGDDIRIRLQNIVDGKSFNENYNYVLSTYLHDPDMMVSVNNSKTGNSFWSYCMGLSTTGKGVTHIISAVLDMDEVTGKVNKLVVMQEPK